MAFIQEIQFNQGWGGFLVFFFFSFFFQCCDKVIGESSWEMNYLDFLRASDKFAELLRKLSRQELREERPNSPLHCFRMCGEEGAAKRRCCGAGRAGGCSSRAAAVSLEISVKYALQLHTHRLIRVASQAQKN